MIETMKTLGAIAAGLSAGCAIALTVGMPLVEGLLAASPY